VNWQKDGGRTTGDKTSRTESCRGGAASNRGGGGTGFGVVHRGPKGQLGRKNGAEDPE